MNCSAFDPGNSDNPEVGLNFRVAVCKIGREAYYTEEGKRRIEKYARVISHFLRVLFLRKCRVLKRGHESRSLPSLSLRTQERRGRPGMARGDWTSSPFSFVSFRKPCLSNVVERWGTMNYAGIVRNGTRRNETGD